MSLVALVCAKGAPGVTTLAVALAALAGPRAAVADLDPAGGDLALRYRSPDGHPLDPDTGLLSLAATLRGERISGERTSSERTGSERTGSDQTSSDRTGSDRAGDDPLAPHLQAVAGGLPVLAGVRRPEQMSGLASSWPQVVRALTGSARHPVIADCGRVGPGSPVLPVLHAADAVVVLARAELEELAHLRERLPMIAAALPPPASLPRPATTAGKLGVLLVAPDRDRASAASRTQQLLRAAGLRVPVIGAVADDPKGADVLRGLRRGRPERTVLVRTARAVLPSVLALGSPIAAPEHHPAPTPAAGSRLRPVRQAPGAEATRPAWVRS